LRLVGSEMCIRDSFSSRVFERSDSHELWYGTRGIGLSGSAVSIHAGWVIPLVSKMGRAIK
ncbi:hypothetical protein, partial [uncultured Enterococcus sp.]|uniref:hypothetical protein n=1 Tax=uncultured Enterococcus sp. TaxID=167972 RepID=UPI00258343EB